MATEYIDIIDTAVKIGLGALISGVSSYSIVKLRQTNDSKKEVQKRKLDIIEDAVARIEDYFSGLTEFLSAIEGVHKTQPNISKLDPDNTTDTKAWSFLYEYDVTYCDSRNQRAYAISILRLIGLSKVIESLRDLDEIDHEVRDRVMFKKEIPTKEIISAWQRKIIKIKEGFYSEISRNYTA